jgi:hypothetical protein
VPKHSEEYYELRRQVFCNPVLSTGSLPVTPYRIGWVVLKELTGGLGMKDLKTRIPLTGEIPHPPIPPSTPLPKEWRDYIISCTQYFYIAKKINRKRRLYSNTHLTSVDHPLAKRVGVLGNAPLTPQSVERTREIVGTSPASGDLTGITGNWIGAETVAMVLDLSLAEAQRMLQTRQIPSYYLAQRWLTTLEDIVAWVTSKRTGRTMKGELAVAGYRKIAGKWYTPEGRQCASMRTAWMSYLTSKFNGLEEADTLQGLIACREYKDMLYRDMTPVEEKIRVIRERNVQKFEVEEGESEDE